MNELKRLPKEGYGFIYRIDFENGKSYIGQTRNSVHERMIAHNNQQMLVDRAIRKGNPYTVSIISECPLDVIDVAERYCILHFKTLRPNGYNILLGGGAYKKYTDEYCKRMSERFKKYWATHPEGRQAISDSLKQYFAENPERKMKPSPPTRSVICLETHKVYAKIYDVKKEFNVNVSSMNGVLKGERDTLAGHHWIEYSEDNLDNADEILQCLLDWERTKREFNAKRSVRIFERNRSNGIQGYHKRIRCLETGIVYDTIRQCAEDMGLSLNTLYCYLNGHPQSVNGYHFERL